jgi:hypothetical protein
MDFMHDSLSDDRSYRLLDLVIESIGKPSMVRCDNGSYLAPHHRAVGLGASLDICIL